MNRNVLRAAAAAVAVLVFPLAAPAQTTVSEDFTGGSTTNSWYFFNGACLTAGSASGVEPAGQSAGQLPGCTAIGLGGGGHLYYREALVGGYNGVAGPSQTLPDPRGHGALRFTNGSSCSTPSATSPPGACVAYSGGFSQNGGVVSATPFPTGQGLAITFRTVTYRGNAGGAAGDGADGMSFFLMDASQLNPAAITGAASGDGNGLGAWGGSLGYTCSNSNPPYNGLIGGYIGLGIDEYGNFLNGTANTLGEAGTTAGGDNTATGGGFKPGRIGLRGAGNVAWAALTGAYGNNPGSPGSPYYPAALATSCVNGGGTYNAATGSCEICASGTTYNAAANQCERCATGVAYNAATNTCDSCPSGQTYDATTNSCQSCASGSYDAASNSCTSCPSGQTYDATTNTCQSCPSGQTYNPSSNQCEICSGGSYVSGTGQCESCPSGATYDPGSNTCFGACTTGTWNGNTNTCQTCANGYTYDASLDSGGECYRCGGSKVYVAGLGMCCPAGTSYNPATQSCSDGTAPTSPNNTATPGTGTTLAANGTTPSTANPTSGPPNAAIANPPQNPSPSHPSGGRPDSYYAVQNTCRSGSLWNYSVVGAPTSAGAATLGNPLNTGLASAGVGPILDYGAIPNAYAVLPTGTQIANESAMSRGAATPISYNLKISQSGLLSLSYSINGGAYQQVIKSQSITASNGPLPASFLFGFAGSSGGSSNIHEILCFKAAPLTTAAASAGASQRQSAQLETGAQAFFAFYNPNGWTGRVTANALSLDQYGNVVVAQTANWDASCVLTGVGRGTCPTTGVAGPTAPQAPASRAILTWNGSQGVPFEYDNLATSQRSAIDAGDNSSAACNASTGYDPGDRVNFLRGDRSCEINPSAVGLFRARTSVLADIIDSSPAWVGPPNAPYPARWNDRINPASVNAENASGTPTYVQYAQSNLTRLNVVYAGANDGLLHAFRSGSYNANGTFCSTAGNCSGGSVTPNDGHEVLAYMPGAVVQSIHNAGNPAVDYSASQYGHAFSVDATPGTGDLFYNNAWHTWVVGGLGPGGSAIYALDVTNPGSFSESNASSLVIGEWTPASISCAGASTANGGPNCGNNLGNTYGTPSIRRLHNGAWAVIFGNGLGSASGDAGIYVMTIDPGTASTAFYYLSTSAGSAASPNGIAYASPVDLDGDHITDYVYAGDLQGNVWRFDLTSSDPGSWAVTPGPLFTAPAGQPITTAIVAASGAPYPGLQPYLMLLFGTGEKFPLTNLKSATYASGTQTIYGVWDWNMTAWNSLSGVQYAALPAAGTGLGGTSTLQAANLQAQTATINAATGNRDMASAQIICWQGTSTCSGSNSQFGWYLNLPGAGEQIIYNPELVQQALTVNSIVPAANDPTACATPTDTGFSYVLFAMTGAVIQNNGQGVFLPPSELANPVVNTNPAYLDANAIAMQTNATGTSFITSNSSGTMYLIYETNQVQGGSGAPGDAIQGGSLGLNLPPNTTGRRISWIERR